MNVESMISLIPAEYILRLSSAREDDLIRCVVDDVNLLDEVGDNLTLAYGVYKGLSPSEREEVKRALSELTVEHVLMYIADNNMKIFEMIERLEGRYPIIGYIEKQIERIKALPHVFDEMMAEGL